MKDSIVKDKSFEFALNIITVYQQLKLEKEFIIAQQLLKSGTSIGANIEEALAGYSLKDFTAKMSISLKESHETSYWLRLIKASKISNINKMEKLILDCKELTKILSSIIKTSKLKIKNS